MSDLLDRQLVELVAEREALEPQVEAYRRINEAIAVIEPLTAAGPKGSTKGAKSSRRIPGRPKGSGVRANQFVAAIEQQPGQTVAQVATKIGANPHYLYRVGNDLVREKRLRVRSRKYYPAGYQ